MGKVLTVGPHKAVIVTRKREKKIISGGWLFGTPFSNVQYLSLRLMTLQPYCNEVETVEGVSINVSAVAQCKVMNTPEFILIAAEQFLGKRPHQIAAALCLTLEGHLRAILGTLTVEETYKDRKKFAGLVREVAETDVAKMGIQIVSFVIKDIDDNVGYLKALGKTRTAAVKRDAEIGKAFANRDAGIREAECEREAKEIICRVKLSIENHQRSYNVKQSEYDAEVNKAQAEAALAYSLQLAKIQQQVRHEEIAIEIIEKTKKIDIEVKEIARKENELLATIKLPSEAESYRIQKIAQGNKEVVIAEAVGESERIKIVGEAEAQKVKVTGTKEADKMKLRALALQKYGDAAIKQLVIQSLPQFAAQVCAPLSKIEELLILGGDDSNLISHLTALAGQIPPVMNALNIVDLKSLVSKLVPNENK